MIWWTFLGRCGSLAYLKRMPVNCNKKEDVLFQPGDAACSGKRKLGTQMKGTIPKNIDRIGIAHLEVESLDTALMDARSRFGLFITKKERSRCQGEYKEKSTLLDGAYSELKPAQDVLSKSMTQHRTLHEK